MGQEAVLTVSGRCLKVCGKCLKGVSQRYLEGVLKISGRFLNVVWKVSGKCY